MGSDLYSFTKLVNSNLTAGNIIINILVAIIVSVLIFYVYKRTYDGVIYSRSFNMTLMMVTVVTSMVMMIIGSNLALSLGMVGALSIIRFRTPVKDPKDLGFLFWSIAGGLAAGTGSHMIAVLGSGIIAAMVLVFKRLKDDRFNYLLIARGANVEYDAISAILDRTGARYSVKMKVYNKQSDEVIFELSLTPDQEKKLLTELKEVKSVESVNLVSYSGEIAG